MVGLAAERGDDLVEGMGYVGHVAGVDLVLVELVGQVVQNAGPVRAPARPSDGRSRDDSVDDCDCRST